MNYKKKIYSSIDFNNWIDTFIEEKGIDLEDTFEITSSKGEYNLMPYGVVIEHMKIASPEEQAAIKNMIVKIDFNNADVKGYLKHLGKAIVENRER